MFDDEPELAMTLQHFLTVGAEDSAADAHCLLGETGWTLHRSNRPSSRLFNWLNGEDIPERAREILGMQLRFAEASGLIRVPPERENLCGIREVWILARTTSGLASIVVCDARGSLEAQFHRRIALAKEQASRYFARQALLLVQSQDSMDNMNEFVKFSAIHGHPNPVSDRIYSMPTENDIAVSYVWLGPLT